MKETITLLLLFITSNLAWASITAVGLDRNEVVVSEYWKFKNGEKSNELMIFNPTKKAIKVVFRKWYGKSKFAPKKVYFDTDILLETKRIRPNQYLLFEDTPTKMRNQHQSLVEVLVNDKRVGLYNLRPNKKEPITQINNGIIINKTPNIGSYTEYEIIYKDLEFKKSDMRKIEVAYLKKDFYYSSFYKSKTPNIKHIEIADIKVSNLKIEETKDSTLLLTSTGKLGSFELKFHNLNRRKRLSHTSFFHMVRKGVGQGISFPIPNGIDFEKKRKYAECK